MASYKGHLAGGALFGAIYIAVLSATAFLPPIGAMLQPSWVQTLLYLFGVAMVFALWPDVDTNSKGQDLFYGIFFVADIWLIFLDQYELAAYLGLVAILPILGKHRGWTHSFWAMPLVPLPFLIVPYAAGEPLIWPLTVYGAAVVGIFSHLWFDGLVKKRVIG